MFQRLFALCAAVACLAISPAGIAAPEVPRDPLLRIETGSHLAPITRISVDAAGNWAVTASEDKTARLWDARSGRAMAILRPPIGPESVGAIYAAAMSPDGRQVALGGNAGFDGQRHALYLFDRATAALPPRSTLAGLEAPVTQLAWSRDSQLIAIGLRQEGLRVFRRNLGFVGADPEFNDAVYGADFSRDGRLAVAGLDGALRIYGFGKAGMQRQARKLLSGKPYGVAWSPDGTLVAVGLQDAARVLILDAATLDTVHVAEVPGGGNLGRVAWSANGQTLYAGGSALSDGRFAIFAFANGGRGAPRPLGSFANTVTSLASSTAGLAAASAEPAWAVYDAGGASRFGMPPRNPDFRDAGDGFRVSANGQQISFPVAQGGRDILSFDLALGELKTGTQGETATPRIPPGLANWKNSPGPRLDGRLLGLRAGELSRSVAAAADGQRFALGGDWFLRLFSADGALVWEKRTPGTAWAVNVSGDGRWVLAALGDGSIRWYRSSDGEEQLALFAHGDRERWIVWTPSGYYDTSVGGENLVGWHVNRAFNQAADFFPVGRFRNRFYQPGMIQKVALLADEREALRAFQAEAARETAGTRPAPASIATSAGKGIAPAEPAPPRVTEVLPPVLELQTERLLETNDALVPIRYAVRTPANAPVKDLKVRVNGKLERNIKTRSLRGTAGDAALFEVQVPVPAKDSEILLIAENRNAKSEPVAVAVRRPAAAAGKPAFIEKYETLYMFVVAVNDYPGENALKLPVKDADDFQRQMTRIANPPPGKARLYERSVTRVLVDRDATQANIREGLKWLRDSVKEKDAGVIFLAGHGMSQQNSYYFIPFKPGSIGRQDEWISGTEIVDTLQNLPGRAMFFLDTCHSGALANQAKVAGTLNQVDEERGVIVFASATAKELAQETDEWGNGAFTKALVEGLRGEAEDARDKLVYPSTLKRYVTRRVRELTENQQRPYISDHGIDDPIAVVVK